MGITKPRPDFPLFPHATGRWAKKIKGRFFYFGKTADDPSGQQALERYICEHHPVIEQPIQPQMPPVKAVDKTKLARQITRRLMRDAMLTTRSITIAMEDRFDCQIANIMEVLKPPRFVFDSKGRWSLPGVYDYPYVGCENPVCGTTFAIDREEAIRLRLEFYFCSDDCWCTSLEIKYSKRILANGSSLTPSQIPDALAATHAIYLSIKRSIARNEKDRPQITA